MSGAFGGGLIQRREDPGSGGVAIAGPEAPPLDDRGQVINDFLESYQRIDVEVPMPDLGAPYGQQWTGAGAGTTRAHASVPYWNNKYVKEVDGEKLTPPAGFDASARATALGQLGVDLNSAVAVARGRPDEIASLVGRAITLGLIGKPGYAPVSDAAYWAAAWKPKIEAWLVRVGIGIDCSGFVYQALHAVRRETDAETTGEHDGYNGILDSYPNEEKSRTGVGDEPLGDQGIAVTAPDDLQVADVMHIPDHIRIIMYVDRTRSGQGITEFITAESTVDGRYRARGATNGPRTHYWRYVAGALQHRYEGAHEWLASNESPTYRRHLGPPEQEAQSGDGRPVQRKGAGAAPAGARAAPPAAGPGEALPAPTRHKMERAFGADFEGVRVHQGEAAPALGAQAFADGEHLHFAPGRYQPGSQAGDELLGHELAHVVQQRDGRVATPQGKGGAVVDDPALEAEADRMGEEAAAGEHVAAPAAGDQAGGDRAAAPAGRSVQRKDEEGSGGVMAQAGGGFDGLLAEIDRVITQPAAPNQPSLIDRLRPAVTPLVTWCRAHLPDQAQVQSFLRSSAGRDWKISVIGRLGDELARMELMLGGLYNGAPSGTSWRTNEGSEGLFPATYLAAAGGLSADENWCTAFAGFGFGRLGADAGVTDYLGSGPKQREHGAVVFPQDSWILLRHLIDFWQADASRQVAITSLSDLVSGFLRDASEVLDRIDPANPGGRTPFEQYLYDAGASSPVVTSMKQRTVATAWPHPGDLLILNTQGPATGKHDDHTAMVDRFSFPTLFTVEGNLGDGTGTRALDLTDRDQRGQIYFISRPAQQIVDTQGAAGGAGGGATGSGAAGDPSAGIAQLRSVHEHNERMHAVFVKLSSSGSTAPYSAPAHEWSH